MLFRCRSTDALVALLVAVVVAGCGPSAATDANGVTDPTATPTATSSPTAAASPSPTLSPAASAPEGWERFESPEGGFAISLPRGWEAADLTAGDFDDMAKLLRENPQTEAFADQLAAMAEQGVAFFAVSIDADTLASGFATNVNIISQTNVGMSLDPFAAANISFVESAFSTDVTRDDVALPVGDAVRADYEAMIGGARVHQTQYYVIVGDRAIITTFSRAAGDEFADRDDEFTRIIETLEVLP